MEIKLRIIKSLILRQPRKTTELRKELKIKKTAFYSALKVLTNDKIVKYDKNTQDIYLFNANLQEIDTERSIEKALIKIAKESYPEDIMEDLGKKWKETVLSYENLMLVLKDEDTINDIAIRTGIKPSLKLLYKIAHKIGKPLGSQEERADED